MLVCGTVEVGPDELQIEPIFKPRVLIAEDNPLIAMDLENILEGCGCEVIGPVTSAREAVGKIMRDRIDVALIDFHLDDGTAEPVAKLLDRKGLPYAICTGSADEGLSASFPNTTFIGKPFNTDDVCIVVNSLIASRLAKP